MLGELRCAPPFGVGVLCFHFLKTVDGRRARSRRTMAPSRSARAEVNLSLERDRMV